MKKIQITIVGAGNYGTLVFSKYKKNKNAEIKSIITPNKTKSQLKKASIIGIPLYRSPKKWKKSYGKPSKVDVFDLCVHVKVLSNTLEQLVKIGARNFILPKPVAINSKDLQKITQLINDNDLNVVIASQWYYASLVKNLRSLVNEIKNDISKIELSFSQKFSGKRALSYTPTTALLPHMLQIVYSMGIFNVEKDLNINHLSNKSILITGKNRKIKLSIESDLSSKPKKQLLKVFLKNNKHPILIANFTGIFSNGRFIEYPYIRQDKEIVPVPEEPLEKMISDIVCHFSSSKNNKALTFKKYLPIAKAQLKIEDGKPQTIGVIGGGIFGILTGLEISRKGYGVTIFEKGPSVLSEASLVNQCRIHMGYHYPRDKETAQTTLSAKEAFCRMFPEAITEKEMENYYCIATQKSKTSPNQFIAFCNELGLPYKKTWPKHLKLNKNKIALSLKVPEPTFDVRYIRNKLLKKINRQHKLKILTSADVKSIKIEGNRYKINYLKDGEKNSYYVGAIVNATYANINNIHKATGLPMQKYQYELCEMPVIEMPIKKPTGVAIMDGPFSSIMSFGRSKEFLLYDVDLSVLERSIGKLPKFKLSISYYNKPDVRKRRFDKYIKKISTFMPQVREAKYLYSLYTTRIVLPNRERDDARPTILTNPAPGFWSVFSGKITTCIPYSKKIAKKVIKFMK